MTLMYLCRFHSFKVLYQAFDMSGKSFKDTFKFYKRKKVELDLSEVFDFDKCNDTFQFKENKIRNGVGIDWEMSYGMVDPEEWSVITFSSKPGLIYIRNPFTTLGQRYWVARCLKDFTKKPNHLNIDSLDVLNGNEDWWEYCQRECDTAKGKCTLEKLRWATLGYHHNWDTKEYSEDFKSKFPEDLKLFCEDLGKVFGFNEFKAEAGIINMYHMDSSLNGHTDHSEINLEAPLFSFSFGQSAIFLLGGKSMDENPLALLLRSGDIIIMSKEARLCYHGVPRIIIDTENTCNGQIGEEKNVLHSTRLDRVLLSNLRNDSFWKPFDLYISKSRINMNIRQVLCSGQTKLS